MICIDQSPINSFYSPPSEKHSRIATGFFYLIEVEGISFNSNRENEERERREIEMGKMRSSRKK